MVIPVINELLAALVEKSVGIRMKKAKELMLLSETKPEDLYDHFDFFIELLDNKNNVLRWNSLIIISNLVTIDREKKFEKISEKYLSLMFDEGMVTTSNFIKHSWKLIKFKSSLSEKTIETILQIDKTSHTPECKDILRGQAITAFENCIEEIQDNEIVLKFIKHQTNNQRNAVRKKAEKFMKKHENIIK
ncbi:MAG: hypothetical protein ACXACX_18800 [Candidatus Hodarchaeales archaeon]|jgi:hypothetical protein